MSSRRFAPLGTFGNVQRHFWLSQQGVCVRHLSGGCETPHGERKDRAQDARTPKTSRHARGRPPAARNGRRGGGRAEVPQPLLRSDVAFGVFSLAAPLACVGECVGSTHLAKHALVPVTSGTSHVLSARSRQFLLTLQGLRLGIVSSRKSVLIPKSYTQPGSPVPVHPATRTVTALHEN